MLSHEAERGELAEALGRAAGWERGWMLAALGRYGQALDALEQAMLGPDRARALGTRASVFRQLALHELGERDDDAALAVVEGAAGQGAQGAQGAQAVRASLLVGKVADALGLGLRDEWRARLDAARQAVEAHGDWRQRLRLAWVTGETAMYEGDPERAAPHFAEAVARAVDGGARRHEAKSHLFLGAAHSALGNRSAAQGHARAALRLAQECDARPLVWASALVLAEAGEDADANLALASRVLGEIVDGLPADLRAAALTREPARSLLTG